jgi:hypothetical protein
MAAMTFMARDTQFLAPPPMVRAAVCRTRVTTISWLALAKRDRTKATNTSEEDALKWT